MDPNHFNERFDRTGPIRNRQIRSIHYYRRTIHILYDVAGKAIIHLNCFFITSSPTILGSARLDWIVSKVSTRHQLYFKRLSLPPDFFLSNFFQLIPSVRAVVRYRFHRLTGTRSVSAILISLW